MVNPDKILISHTNKFLTIPELTYMHNALFFAIFIEWNIQNCPEWLRTNRKRLMFLSGINSPVSYHRCLKMLIKHNILEYKPSFHPILGSKLKIIIDAEFEPNSALLPNKKPPPSTSINR